jgi:hypothetical protein
MMSPFSKGRGRGILKTFVISMSDSEEKSFSLNDKISHRHWRIRHDKNLPSPLFSKEGEKRAGFRFSPE